MERTLATERLELRVPVAADLAAVATSWKDPELVKFIGRHPLSREQALSDYGVFAVIERATGRYVGEVGIANFERDAVPPTGKFEMDWIISPLVQARGYASEAVLAVLALHDRYLPREVVSCSIHVDHVASLRVAAKAGSTLAPTIDLLNPELEEGTDHEAAMNFGSGMAYAFICTPCDGPAQFLWQQ